MAIEKLNNHVPTNDKEIKRLLNINFNDEDIEIDIKYESVKGSRADNVINPTKIKGEKEMSTPVIKAFGIRKEELQELKRLIRKSNRARREKDETRIGFCYKVEQL